MSIVVKLGIARVKKVKYCVDCGRKLTQLTKTDDWSTRKLHKKCWRNRQEDMKTYLKLGKEYIPVNKYCTDTGQIINVQQN